LLKHRVKILQIQSLSVCTLACKNHPLSSSVSIRTKIFLLAGILLVLFGVVVGTLATMQHLDGQQISNIVRYEQPLSRLISEFDVGTDRYELNVMRELRLDTIDPDQLQAATSAKQALADDLRKLVDRINSLMQQAVRDSRYRTQDRVDLAGIESSFRYVVRNLDGFLAMGEHTMNMLAEGKREEARVASLGFQRYSLAFGPDLADIRHRISSLTESATQDVLARQRLNTRLSFALFVAACGIGLGISAVGSARAVSGLRQLVASARAIASGANSTPVVILTRDEVGELALTFNHMMEELRSRERIKDTFGKFVDPRLINQMIGSGADQAERRTLTVFFSDISEFSSISEQLTASAVVNLLNSYFGVVATVIHEHRGFIDKYIGDAIMAFWLAPFSPSDDHASDACLAALAQQEAIATLRKKLPDITGMRRNPPKLEIRMGIATGEAVVGTIGSESSRSYTVMGDTVNLASRLESINKFYRSSIIISEDTFRLAQHAIEVRELDVVTVAGKSEPIRIYEVMSRAGGLGPDQFSLRTLFAEGLEAYRVQDWDKAQNHFEDCLRHAPNDGPARLMLERITVLRKDPPAMDWQGIWRFAEK
jgi:adenylate cyclase